MFLEEDVQPIVNLADPSIVFPGPRRVKAQIAPDAPLPMIPPATTSSKVGKPSLFSSQLEHLFLILQSLHHCQYLLMQSLHQLSLQQLVMTLEAFLSQVAWPGVQLPSIRGGGDTSGIGNNDATNAGANDYYVADIPATKEAWDLGPTQD